MSITFYISEDYKKLEKHIMKGIQVEGDINDTNCYPTFPYDIPRYLKYTKKDINKEKIFFFCTCIDGYLHPKWQRIIVPKLIELFPNAKMHLGTNSPFVLNSVEGATIINLDTKQTKKRESKGESFTQVLLDDFEITFNQHFDKDTQNILDKFSIKVKEFYQEPSKKAFNKVKKEFKPYMAISREIAEIINFNLEKMYKKIPRKTSTADSVYYTLSEDFGINAEYGEKTQTKLNQFFEMLRLVKNGVEYDKKQFNKLTKELKNSGEEIKEIVLFETRKKT